MVLRAATAAAMETLNSWGVLQGCDDLGKRPLGHRVTNRLLQTLDTLALLAHRPQKLFEHNTLLAMHKLLQHEPIHVGRPPRVLAWIMSPSPATESRRRISHASEPAAGAYRGHLYRAPRQVPR
jgi:hypothetical protein